MKSKILLLLAFVSTLSSLKAQIRFEKGYFINNAGEKTECLIKNEGWRSNPKTIQYKLNKTDKLKSFDITNIKEFGIYESSKFIRKKVEIDLSSLKPRYLSHTRSLNFETRTLFLRVLVEGKANLYSFRDRDKVKYFYNVNNSKTEQLIYHLFLKSQTNNNIIENNQYKSQLTLNVSCGAIINKLEYNNTDLVSYFYNYNICSGLDSSSIYKEKERKGKVNLYAKTGIEFTQMKINDGGIINSIITEFSNTSVPTFGAELEYILPFKNNKWGTFISFMYRGFKMEGTRSTISTNNKVRLNYKSIEMALGLRYYFFLNKDSSIFFEGYPNFSYVLNDKNTALINVYETVEIPSTTKIEAYELNFSLGIGFKYKKAFIKGNYFTNNDLFDKNTTIESDYTKLVITIGYNFL